MFSTEDLKTAIGATVIARRNAAARLREAGNPRDPFRALPGMEQQSSSHCANLIVILPQETFPLGESSKSPLHFAAHRDESVIVGYYTSAEVHLRSPSPLDEP